MLTILDMTARMEAMKMIATSATSKSTKSLCKKNKIRFKNVKLKFGGEYLKHKSLSIFNGN